MATQGIKEPQGRDTETGSSLCEPLDAVKSSVEDPQPSSRPSDEDLSIHVYKPSVFSYRKKPTSALEGAWIIASDVVLPLIVVAFGTLCSVVSLYLIVIYWDSS